MFYENPKREKRKFTFKTFDLIKLILISGLITQKAYRLLRGHSPTIEVLPRHGQEIGNPLESTQLTIRHRGRAGDTMLESLCTCTHQPCIKIPDKLYPLNQA